MNQNIVDKVEKPEPKGIFDYLTILLNYKKAILIPSVIVALLVTVLMFFVIKPEYYSYAVVKSSQTSSMGLGGMLTNLGVPDLGGLDELGMGSSSKELALYKKILESRRCIEETIIKYSLMEEYDFQYMQDAVKVFREDIMEIKIDKTSSTIEIGVYNTDKTKSKDIADFLVHQLNTIYSELSITDAKNNREFIEERYTDIKDNLRIMEDSLKVYQDQFGISPDIQIKAAAESEIQLEVQISTEEIKLDMLRKILTPNQPEILAQENKIVALKSQLNKIQTSPYSDNKLGLKGSPDIVLNFLRLKRDVEIQNKILAFIIPLFEQAKIDEKKNTPVVLVLDQPYIADRKARPKRLTTILISLVFSIMLISSTVIVYETFYKNLMSKFKER